VGGVGSDRKVENRTTLEVCIEVFGSAGAPRSGDYDDDNDDDDKEDAGDDQDHSDCSQRSVACNRDSGVVALKRWRFVSNNEFYAWRHGGVWIGVWLMVCGVC